LGLGRENRAPNWAARAGPVDRGRTIASNGYAALPLDQNRRWSHRTLALTISLPRSLLSHAAPKLSERRPALCRRRRTTPPWAPSLARASTDGWTHHRRVAPRRGPTRAHPQGSRSDGVLRPSMTRLPELDGFSCTAPCLAAVTMARLKRAHQSRWWWPRDLRTKVSLATFFYLYSIKSISFYLLR
jgi:hypothetical protein